MNITTGEFDFQVLNWFWGTILVAKWSYTLMANIQHPWMLVIHILNICKDSIFLFTTLDQCKRKRLCVSECLCVSNWWRYRPRYAFLSFFCWWCHLQNHFPHSIPTSFVIFFFLCDLNLLKRSKSARTHQFMFFEHSNEISLNPNVQVGQ